MIITIITGGTGSLNIQEGIYNINSNISLNLVINGYDDGKSTGVLRNLFLNTLGISDFRKNQVFEYKLRNGNNDIYKLLNYRFTEINPYEHLNSKINNIKDIDNELKIFLLENLNYFFDTPESKNIIYEDFSFMNIIYCSLLKKNNSDMEVVCNIIKNKLKLKNNIFLNSNDNLILYGITKNNKKLNNEASIVDFNDKDDKIIDVFFNNNYPILNKNTEELLLNSNIILFSCGTQFSSLIPTYKTLLFNETIKKSRACKYLVLNCDYDKDIINYTGNELLNKINEYLTLNEIKIIISDDINNNLFPSIKDYIYINIPKLIQNNKHNGFLLWKYILNDYFNNYFNKFYLFDYDNTLYDKDLLEVSLKNIKLLENIDNKIIFTNNDIKNLLLIKDTVIYSNICNLYNNNSLSYILNKDLVLNDYDIKNIYGIIKKIDNYEIFLIENRKNISISIKPVENRDELIKSIKIYINNTDLDIVSTGKTTLEFIKKRVIKT